MQQDQICTINIRVLVRHAANCSDKKRGNEWRRCNCPKVFQMYDGKSRDKAGRLVVKIRSAHTRSWQKAEKRAQEWLDSFDPEKQELKRLRAEKERQSVTVEEAVALYHADMVARLGDNGTLDMSRSLLGDVDVDRKTVKSDGHLFGWLKTQVDRPGSISEFSPAHLTKWRASWEFGDLTARQRWGMVRAFFNFCEAHGWIDDSPARKLKALKVAKGNRTAIFTDEQYSEILDTVYVYDPENIPAATRKSWQQRIATFLELLRWSGMDIVDAVNFTPDLIDKEGVLRYRRQKTGVLATIPLPEQLVVMLRDVPLERDSVGHGQPFRQKDCEANSDTRTWARRLEVLFKLAGITQVKTDHRTRRPHVKMLRDTFAVWHLRHGAKLHTVSKMLGHAKTNTTEQAYLPWVKELEQAHIEDARASLAKANVKRTANVVKMSKR